MPAGRVRDHRRRRERGLGDHRGRHRARGDRDDGRARDRGRRGRGELRLPRRRRRGAHRRARRPAGRRGAGVRRRPRAVRAGRRDRDQRGGRPGRAGGDVGGPQVRLRGGRPHRPAYIVQDGVVPRTALGQVLDEIAELSAERASASPTCSTRATATCTRSCSTTTACPGRPRRRDAVRSDPGPVHRPRRVDHRRARRRGRQVAAHAEDVRRGRPRHDAVAALRVRPGRRCATRARCSRRPGCAARFPGRGVLLTRWWPRGRWINFEQRYATPRSPAVRRRAGVPWALTRSWPRWPRPAQRPVRRNKGTPSPG